MCVCVCVPTWDFCALAWAFLNYQSLPVCNEARNVRGHIWPLHTYNYLYLLLFSGLSLLLASVSETGAEKTVELRKSRLLLVLSRSC